jgi:hypothetical protein
VVKIFALDNRTLIQKGLIVSEKNSSSMEQVALAFYFHAATMIKEGKSRKEILKDLTSKGVSLETAENMLDKIELSRANVARRSGYRNAFIGTVLIGLMLIPLLGIGILQVTGAMFFVAIIILSCGIFAFGRGIMQITGL